MSPRIPTAIAIASLSVLALASCASPEPETSAVPEPPSAIEPTTEPIEEAPDAESTAPPADPTCETIISEGTVSALTDLGWTAQLQDFQIGEQLLEGGLYCAWADWAEPSDHGQFFAWAALTDDESATAQAGLMEQGWAREGDYFTESEPSFETDEDGYGMTYLFGDGWVKFADTKQSLVLIEWP